MNNDRLTTYYHLNQLPALTAVTVPMQFLALALAPLFFVSFLHPWLHVALVFFFLLRLPVIVTR